MELKPFLVELKVAVVVMASSETHAMKVAESNVHQISSNEELSCDSAEVIKSLQDLNVMDSSWTGDSIPYGGDGTSPLKSILTETSSDAKDIYTIDMFEEQKNAFALRPS